MNFFGLPKAPPAQAAGGSFSFTGTKIAKNATAPSKLKCNTANAVIPKSIPVKNNAFRYSGKLKGQAGTIVFKGHWKTDTTIAGSATVTKGSCTSKKSFTATYSGPAIPMVGVPGS